jgi:hypothetical protein
MKRKYKHPKEHEKGRRSEWYKRIKPIDSINNWQRARRVKRVEWLVISKALRSIRREIAIAKNDTLWQ